MFILSLTVYTQVRGHTYTEKIFALLGSCFLLQPQTGHLAAEKPAHQDTMSLACPSKCCTHSELPENGFCEMKVSLKLLVEHSISRLVSRQKILNMLENEAIQLYLPCVILHKYWIWGFDNVYLCIFFLQK